MPLSLRQVEANSSEKGMVAATTANSTTGAANAASYVESATGGLVSPVVPAPQATPVTTYLLRPVVLGGALIGMIGAWVQRPHPVRWLLRRSRKITRRTTKRVGRTARLTAHRGAKQAKQWREIVLRPLRDRR